MSNFLAIDLGATSGRSIIGTILKGRLALRELTRFPNRIVQIGGHSHWNILSLYDEIINSLKQVQKEHIKIQSIGIDTWGVDFACFGRSGELLGNPHCYRDAQTFGESTRFFETVSRDAVYDITGIQIMDINSLYQMSALHRLGSSPFENADKVLFMPDALSYLLTGEMVTEYTIASTSQLLEARTRRFNDGLLGKVGLKSSQFGKFVLPGTVVGALTKTVQELTGLPSIPVIAVAGHDTASAVAAVPASDSNFAYLSSGTWSLMGIEVTQPIITKKSFESNFTNEGGIDGTIRFLRNITGLWLFEQCRKEWDSPNFSYDRLDAEAAKIPPFRSLVNPDATAFVNPPSMVRAIQNYCEKTDQIIPKSEPELTRCIYDSLAMRYRQVFSDLSKLSPFPINKLHIIGGGSKNAILNQFTADALGIPVLAGPQEATALGNILLQARTAGMVKDIRELVRQSVNVTTYVPSQTSDWTTAYKQFLRSYRA